MNSESEIATHMSSSHAPAWLNNITKILLASAFVAVCAHITLPLSFTPVPLTLQPFAVLLLGMVLSPTVAAGSLMAYLLEGMAGLPVFTPSVVYLDGFERLFGPTGGYLLSYPVAAFVVATLWHKGRNRGLIRALIATTAGNLLILLAGAFWLSISAHTYFTAVFGQAVIPFLPGDALKVIAASVAGLEWYRLRPARRSDDPNV